MFCGNFVRSVSVHVELILKICQTIILKFHPYLQRDNLSIEGRIPLGFSSPVILEQRFSLGLFHLSLDYLYCGYLKHALLNCLKPYLKPKLCKGWCRVYINVIVIIDTYGWLVTYDNDNDDIMCLLPSKTYLNRIQTHRWYDIHTWKWYIHITFIDQIDTYIYNIHRSKGCMHTIYNIHRSKWYTLP